jgi:hypothetical protein
LVFLVVRRSLKSADELERLSVRNQTLLKKAIESLGYTPQTKVTDALEVNLDLSSGVVTDENGRKVATLKVPAAKAILWKTPLWGVDECIDKFRTCVESEGRYIVNEYRLFASVHALSPKDHERFIIAAKKIEDLGANVVGGLLQYVESADCTLNRYYEPTMEIIDAVPQVQRIANSSEINEGILDIGEREKIIAHGTSNWLNMPGTLSSGAALLSIMVDGAIRPRAADRINKRSGAEIGWLDKYAEDKFTRATLFGPFFVILYKNDNNMQIHSWDDANWGSIGREWHAIYLVPTANDAKAIIKGLNEAVRIGFMAKADALIAKNKLMTYKQFIQANKTGRLKRILNSKKGRQPSSGGVSMLDIEQLVTAGNVARLVEIAVKGKESGLSQLPQIEAIIKEKNPDILEGFHAQFATAPAMPAAVTGVSQSDTSPQSTQFLDETIASRSYRKENDQLEGPSWPQPLLTLRGHLTVKDGTLFLNGKEISPYRDLLGRIQGVRTNIDGILNDVMRNRSLGDFDLDMNNNTFNLFVPSLAGVAKLDELFINALMSYLTPDEIESWQGKYSSGYEYLLALFSMLKSKPVNIEVIFDLYPKDKKQQWEVELKIVNHRQLAEKDRKKLKDAFSILSNTISEKEIEQKLRQAGIWTEHRGKGLAGVVIALSHWTSLFRFRELPDRTEQIVRIFSYYDILSPSSMKRIAEAKDGLKGTMGQVGARTEDSLPIELVPGTNMDVQRFAALDKLFAAGIAARPPTDGSRVVLSKNLFIDPADDQSQMKLDEIKVALRPILKTDENPNGYIEIVEPKDLAIRAKNGRESKKDKTAVVMTDADWEDARIWGRWTNEDKEREIKSSVLIINGKLTTENYLYLQGVIGLARALMANDREAIRAYYKILGDITVPDDILKLLESTDRMNNVAFALSAILRLRPIEKIAVQELESRKATMEQTLIAA